ncbi:beta-alanine-activating enzyme isoform X2 [Pipistrellus kuhlii]|uniref:beta-alanine-activating enzyme isoform X2 n=1 Tax=Pipistrellus kuhlii TaxID=59472 RepID=UPI00174EE884|nr:beta-alanine-activating enzyme isoform X2 [Pipistrellus kuhlii]
MTLQELVHQAASIYSDKIAVCFDECNDQPPVYYTYKNLISAASELSNFLLLHCDFQGIREIGLYCHPGINVPSWILGIIQVPAAYAPIDPDSPPALSTHFMKKCNLKYILVEKQQINKFKSSYEILLNYDTLTVEHNDLVLFRLYWKNIEVNLMENDRREKYEKDKVVNSTSSEKSNEEKPEEHMDVRLKHCLAYVLHTSGTTGIPKIVRVPHACIVPNIQHFRVLFEITQEDVLFLASPLTFDPSVVEIFVALSSGASLLIVPTSVKVLPSKLAAVLFSRHRVTILQATPTLLRRFGSQLIKSTVLSASTSLRALALGGEAFPSLTVLKGWREVGNRTQIFNVYGITEVSSWATFYRIPEEILNSTLKCELPIQLGFPLLGTVVEVRDTSGFRIEEGTGQVFLGGRNRVCFLDGEVTVPLGTMRATGDFVTVKDGELFFLGRKDSQIKRHGKRLNIELVQQVAEGLQQVESCAVIWYNQEKLILFVVSKNVIVKNYIFKELETHLPSHAIPDELVLIDSLPFTSHGKIDVSELNKIYLNYTNLKSEHKLKGKEELWGKLQHLWKSILSLSEDPLKVPDESLFLNSGGDSLKSIRLLNEIEKLVGTSVPGLLEMILSKPILEIYTHILQTVFPDEDLTFCENYATKRKFSNVNQEETSGKFLPQKSDMPLNLDNGINAFIALSRGSQILSMNATRFLTKLKHCPSACSSDLISQTAIKKVKSLNPPALLGKSKDTTCVEKVCEDGTSVKRAETMELRVRWRADTGKCVDASPLIVVPAVDESSATVFIGSHSHRMMAVDLYSGKVKWEQLLGDRIESSACVSKCGNFIVVGCYNGLVYVLKSKNGEKHWVFTTEDAVKSSATMDPTTGFLYIGSHDQHAYALDIYEKKCVWKLQCGGTIFSSPCLNLIPYHLYVATLGGLLLAVNPATGNTVWKHGCGKPLFSSPRCCLQYVCIGCVDGNLLCFTHFGEQVWQFSTSEPIFSSPCLSTSEQEIFFGSHDCFIYCCTMKGHLQWKFETTSRVYSTPFAFHNKYSNEMLLAAASTDGKLWILESKSGQLQRVQLYDICIPYCELTT